ncbi:MAG: SDR family NAD(P)-dependent oxidoreductase [Nitrososphaerales archaeon]
MRVSAAREPQPTFRDRFGPWALIAGASAGLGAEYANQAAARGLNLFLVARRIELLGPLAARLAAAHGVEVRISACDLARPDLVSFLTGETAGLEIGLLVCSAGYSVIGPFLERPLTDHLLEIDTNCRAPVALAHTYGQGMAERGRGGIILMSSLSANQGSPLIANYGATKAYNLLLAEGLWYELRKRGVAVLACRAGATATPNYLGSLQEQGAGRGAPSMSPARVVAETLAALSRGPSVIPGRGNRLAAFFMQRLLPRRTAVLLMGRVLQGIYG